MILKDFDNSFVEALWNHSSSNGEISEASLNELLEQFKFQSSRNLIGFLMAICEIVTKISADQMKLILQWISLGSSDDFCDVFVKSYVASSSLTSADEFDVDEILSWTERNFIELGLDLAKSVHRVINGESSEVVMQSRCGEVVDNLNSSMIDLPELWILFGCLPSIYLSSAIVEKYLFEHAKYWVMLYHSDYDGLSNRK